MAVDTNVAVVANGRAEQASDDCVLACIDELDAIRAGRTVLLDDHDLILTEYRLNLSHSGQPGVGDAFFKWLWDNQANIEHCQKVSVTPTESNGKGFVEFPDDPELEGFDRSDRVFVATVLSDGRNAPVVNASDTDWWNYREALERNGVAVRFLCPELME
ncbi:MAG TPA: hypothetical protein VN345_18595 [Blastocatellia bacterium]|jgi:hypothetical protein|nr:hypothetical protein [Blastocatellia bacterium]